ncbi:MAG: amino acid-binding protein [Candidatus Verstraetearchaeota archaeon]|jgi:predicted regulator of amino acid metabolism with ACT domain|nr:amino acid-binding protein [Candidatus Verstraetearchaeota archaeon]NHW44458.1 ACT domain-containing protein [Candidatus Verstraetearchaeota archaeon]
MWKSVAEKFEEAPAKLKVARLLIENGLRIGENGKIYCGDVEIPDTKIARVLDVDRRVVRETIKYIMSDEVLRKVFTRLKPAGALLRDVAALFGYGVLEIRADPSAVGIIAGVAQALAKAGISIRQIHAEDPDLNPDPKLIVITERAVPGEVIQEILKVPNVKSVTIIQG